MNNILHITGHCKLKKENEQLLIVKDNIENLISLDNISLIVIDSKSTSLSSASLLLITRAKIPIIITNEKYDPEVFCNSLYSYHRISKNISEQIKWIDSSLNFKIIKSIIICKIQNQINLLEELGLLENNKMINYLDKCNKSETFEEIQSYEALSAKLYFKLLFGKEFIRFNDDKINASLNYGYSILRSSIKTAIISKGLHPSIGLFHHSQFNNYNLSDDIIEIYRPMIDYIVYTYMNNKEEFSKEDRQILTKVILQNVILEDNIVEFNYSLQIYIGSIIKAFNKNDFDILKIPILKKELYEY